MEKERLMFAIGRFDSYYDNVNNKSNIIMGLSAFIFGSLIAVYPALSKIVDFNFWLYLNLFLLATLGFAAVLILIVSAIPHLSSTHNSVLYFESISNMRMEDFKQTSKEMNKDGELEDLRTQTFLLAQGLSKKFRKLKLALVLLIIQFSLLIPYIILIIKHMK